MSSKVRIGPLVLSLVMALFMMLMICGYRMLTRSLPAAKGRLTAPGLESEARIFRDGYGIPHVFAKNQHDLFFTQGFVTAQDRLWQMDFLRHTARGNLSELFGNAALQTDSLMRMSGIRPAAVRQAEELTEEPRRILENYAQGVNAYIEQYKKRLPLEFILLNHVPDPWKPEDSIALFKLMVWKNDVQWLTAPFFTELRQKVDEKRIMDILPPYRIADLRLDNKIGEASEINRFLRSVLREDLLPPPVFGTMSWVVSPKRSVTGKPLFSIITRNALENPSPWYEIFMMSGTYRVSGLSLPGFPMVLLGHNAAVAWGWTDSWNSVPRLDYRKSGTHWIVDWPATGNGMAAVLMLNEAKDWNDFADAAAGFVFSAKRFVYADTAGNIGSLGSGENHPGNDGSGASAVFNPEVGFAGVENLSPENPRCALSLRNKRIRSLLSAPGQLSLEDLKPIQSDVVSTFAFQFMKKVRQGLSPETLTDPFARQLFKSMVRWDGSMKPGSYEAVYFKTFLFRCVENIFADEMGDSLFASFKRLSCLHPEMLFRIVENPRSAWFDNIKTPGKKETASEILAASMGEVVSTLTQEWGSDLSNWSWAGLHTMSFHHPFEENSLYGKMFAVGPFAVGGCETTVFSVDADVQQPFKASAGPTTRVLMDLSNWNNSVSVLPPGQSGQPMDAHFQDQVQFYLQSFYHPELWDSTKIVDSGWDMTTFGPEAPRGRR